MENRKLVRPSLEQYRRRSSPPPAGGQGAKAAPDRARAGRFPTPPQLTNAEAFYYVKQMSSATPMVVVLDGDEEILGRIEWYDELCIKVKRGDGSSLLLYKASIKYLYKLEELDARRAADYPAL